MAQLWDQCADHFLQRSAATSTGQITARPFFYSHGWRHVSIDQLTLLVPMVAGNRIIQLGVAWMSRVPDRKCDWIKGDVIIHQWGPADPKEYPICK